MSTSDTSWDGSRQSFAEAAAWFVDTAGKVGDRWDRPGLGEWDVRALVGHASRAMLTVESYLAQPATAVAVRSATDYYLATRAVAAGPGVAARGIAAGAALGADPVAALRTIAGRVVPLVEECDGGELAGALAVQEGLAVPLLLALTGRAPLPQGFSLL